MNLVIDNGNTFTDFAFMRGRLISHQLISRKMTLPLFKNFFKKYPSVSNIILSSVGKFDRQLKQYLKTNYFFLELDAKTPLPIQNKYKTPLTLGYDRMANAVAGAARFPQKNVLIIDMGTCIKFDFVDAQKNYRGGSISPGLYMRFRALNKFTANLPLINKSEKYSLTGKSTGESILSGVQNGMIYEINGMIAQYKRKYKNLKIIRTGGDSDYFANHLKNPIFAAPNLTLQGLNEILNYNVRQNS